MSNSQRIFINYRHADTAGWVRTIDGRLREEFGGDAVFRDLPSIPEGADIYEEVQRALARTTVMLTCIGPQWLTLRDPKTNEPRIEDMGDLLRVEIEEALAGDITIIPLLLGGASMPGSDDLPSSMRSLAGRMALSLPPQYFEPGLEKLVARLADQGVSPVAPLRAFLGPDSGIMRAGWEMFLPEPPGLIEPGTETGWRANRRWILDHGGADYGASRLRLDLVGLSQDPVHVRAIRARIVSREEDRRPGAAIVSPSAGEIAIVPCVLDLDDDEPVGRRGESPDGFGDPFFGDYAAGDQLVLSVKRGELVPLRIVARARQAIYRWELELDLLVRGEPMTMPVPLETGPIATAARSDLDESYTWGWFVIPNVLGPSALVDDTGRRPPKAYRAGLGPRPPAPAGSRARRTLIGIGVAVALSGVAWVLRSVARCGRNG